MPKDSWKYSSLLLLLLAVISCGRTINRSAERRIRDALPDLIGPAREYRAHVENDPERTLRGRLATVTVDGDDVQLPNGLLLDRLHLDLRGVDFDTNHKRLQSIREARFQATIGEANLDEFLAGESPEGETLRKIRLQLNAGQVTITAERVTLGIGVPFRMTGPLRIVGPSRIEIDPTRLTAVGIPLTGLPLRFLKGRFESAIDLSTLPIPVTLTDAQTAAGKLSLSGSVDAAALIARAQESTR